MTSSDRASESAREILAGDLDEAETVQAAVAWELQCLWHDLFDDIDRALNGEWSIACESTIHRLIVLMKATGQHTPWQQIGMTYLRTGVYEAVMNETGIQYQPVDYDELAQLEQTRRG